MNSTSPTRGRYVWGFDNLNHETMGINTTKNLFGRGSLELNRVMCTDGTIQRNGVEILIRRNNTGSVMRVLTSSPADCRKICGAARSLRRCAPDKQGEYQAHTKILEVIGGRFGMKPVFYLMQQAFEYGHERGKAAARKEVREALGIKPSNTQGYPISLT